jgi:hypothetical protein
MLRERLQDAVNILVLAFHTEVPLTAHTAVFVKLGWVGNESAFAVRLWFWSPRFYQTVRYARLLLPRIIVSAGQFQCDMRVRSTARA